jgi:hypothetical protein
MASSTSSRASVAGKNPALTANLLFKTRLCHFWQQGCCLRGEECSFAHGQRDLSDAQDFSYTRMCEEFVSRGSCTAGSRCQYAHSQEQLRLNPAPVAARVPRQRKRGKRGGAANRTRVARTGSRATLSISEDASSGEITGLPLTQVLDAPESGNYGVAGYISRQISMELGALEVVAAFDDSPELPRLGGGVPVRALPPQGVEDQTRYGGPTWRSPDAVYQRGYLCPGIGSDQPRDTDADSDADEFTNVADRLLRSLSAPSLSPSFRSL